MNEGPKSKQYNILWAVSNQSDAIVIINQLCFCETAHSYGFAWKWSTRQVLYNRVLHWNFFLEPYVWSNHISLSISHCMSHWYRIIRCYGWYEIPHVWSILPMDPNGPVEHAWYKCTTYFGILSGVSHCPTLKKNHPQLCHPCGWKKSCTSW